MKKISIFAYILLLCSLQTRATNRTIDTSANHLYITVNPSQLVDPWEGFFAGGNVEYIINRRYAIQISGGRYLNSCTNNHWGVQRSPNRGYEMKAELKRYLDELTNNHRAYFAIEAMYKHQAFGYVDSFSINGGSAFSQLYHISVFASALNFKYGEVQTWKHFILEYYVGGGIRLKKGTNDLNPTMENSILTGENHGDIIGGCERSIEPQVLPNITFGLNIGYRCF